MRLQATFCDTERDGCSTTIGAFRVTFWCAYAVGACAYSLPATGRGAALAVGVQVLHACMQDILICWSLLSTHGLAYTDSQSLLVSIQYDVVVETIEITVRTPLTDGTTLMCTLEYSSITLIGSRFYRRSHTIVNAADVAVEAWHVALRRINAHAPVQVLAQYIVIPLRQLMFIVHPCHCAHCSHSMPRHWGQYLVRATPKALPAPNTNSTLGCRVTDPEYVWLAWTQSITWSYEGRAFVASADARNERVRSCYEPVGPHHRHDTS